MSDKDWKPAEDDLTPLQGVVWKSTACTSVVLILLFGSWVTDMNDPVIAGIFAFVALLVCWLARKFVKSSVTDEKIRALVSRE